jgi:hypothetical protein
VRGKQRQQRNHRDGGHVLEQQDAKARPANRRLHQPALLQNRNHHRRRRQGQREAGGNPDAPVHPESDESESQQYRAKQNLGTAVAKDRSPQVPEFSNVHLDADDEHHQHDAELGNMQHGIDIRDEPERGGTDEHPGDQIAEDGTEPEPDGERHHHKGRCEE